MRVKVFIACILAISLPSLSYSQEVSNDKRDAIVELIDLSGSLKIADQMSSAIIQQMIPAVRASNPNIPQRGIDILKETVTEHMNNFINSPALMDGIVGLYDKYYTADDISQLIDFYKSPIGKKLASVAPQLAQESTQMTQRLLPAMIPLMQQDLMQRLSDEGISLQAK